MLDSEAIGSYLYQVTDPCPRCQCCALVVQGYRIAGIDRLIAQAFCTSCGLVASEPRDAD